MNKISDFKAVLNKRGGLMRPNKAACTFGLPPVLIGTPNNTELARDFEMMCEATNLPGAQLQTQKIQRWTYGPYEARPFGLMSTPVMLSIHADQMAQYLRFFNRWIQHIQPHDWYNQTIGQQSIYGGRQYELEYKSNYATDFHIALYTENGDISVRYILKEAFPVAVQDIPLGWSDNGTTAKIMVAIEYLDWTSDVL